MAGPRPLYGTCTMRMEAASLSISPVRCGPPPMPPEAKLSLLGFALA